MAINVTANYRLIRSLDPLLRASDAGRAIFVSSGAAHKCLAYWGPYSISKAALEALVRTYAAETVTTPVRAMLVNPGPLRTRMRRAAMPGEDPLTLKTPEDLAPAHREARPAVLERDRQDLRFPDRAASADAAAAGSEPEDPISALLVEGVRRPSAATSGSARRARSKASRRPLTR